MLCSTRTKLPREESPAPASGLGPQTTSAPGIELVGTWDYKWSRDSVIRVAFQDPVEPTYDDAVLAAAKQSIIEKAGRWGVRVRSFAGEFAPPHPVPLTLDFLSEPVSRTSSTFVDYEVLISLQPMPFLLPQAFDRETEEIVFVTQSQLGTYARRSDYGVPTTFLGPPAASDGSNPFAFYDTPEGQHAILHELGHLLGLAHAHQNPRAKPPAWKTNDECVAVMKTVLGGRLQALDVERKSKVENDLSKLIESQVRLPWLAAPEFSDWPAAPDVDEQSVIMYGSYRCMLEGEAGCSGGKCPCLTFRQTPSAGDLRWLHGLYDRTLLASDAYALPAPPAEPVQPTASAPLPRLEPAAAHSAVPSRGRKTPRSEPPISKTP